MLECKFPMWKLVKEEGEKEDDEISSGHVDFEAPQGRSDSGVQQTVGKEGLRFREGKSLDK